MSAADPYFDAEYGLLRNRLGIVDPVELEQVEAELTALRLVELQDDPLPGGYDLAHLQAFHRFVFGDVYDWAGELRSVVIGKGDVFCLPQFIASFASDVFGRLAGKDFLRGLERPRFLDELANLFADVNALHPFREGNGRAHRAFLTQLAVDAGWRLRWASMDPEENVRASQQAHRGDILPLRAMLDGRVDPGEQIPAPRSH
ncbi:Fic/DOC family protein [Pseudonocardia asaccharolytica]|uniref:protein adenylyltransferase n=1 Tax=Pseudonocardia asaccharolytica DSM 44247 = NBRC 16224 TaxID=1123024 RepID=A0A511D176_9PSEU|nr:Fic family protein [Pseudonocardia asaccharolytica]GEL18437.1 Fic family protein [Pseudonocardia asaccharolytica DSM 44247 = NBRC 16224]